MPAVQRQSVDLLDLEAELTDAERRTRDGIREFVDRRIRPNIARWYEDARFPLDIVPELADLGVLGMHLQGYGCPGRSAVEYGLAALELEAGDSGLRTFVSVQGSLAMSAIHSWGSEEQKSTWLPKMAAGEVIGCFALTEPDAGSDPGSMTTRATRDGDSWVITGAKRWIGLASLAQIAVVWAKVTDDHGRDRVRGFLVPTATPGFTAVPIEPKLSMRASVQCDITLDRVRVSENAVLPGSNGLRAPLTCLDEARYGIVWGVLGAARDSLEAALAYAQQRQQFGRPVAAFQLTQQKLVTMALEVQKGQLLALHLGRRKDAGTLQPHMISVGKLNNCRIAVDVARQARTIFGGNGIALEHSPLRHASNLESVRTYEGTDEVHTLVLGERLTGFSAFR